MIPARKNATFSALFARDAERRITGAFEAVRIRGLARFATAVAARPVLVVTNHTAWWDPLVALFVSVRLLGADAYAMMDAANLERLPFFGRVGAFGVALGDPRDGARAIRYGARLLCQPGRLVWVFPQGREVPVTARPLAFRPGAGEIARAAVGAVTVPGAIRYEMGGTPRPSLWLSFGEPLEPLADRRAASVAQERAVTAELDAIDRAIVAGDGAAFDVVRRSRGEGAGLALAQRALAWLTRSRALGR